MFKVVILLRKNGGLRLKETIYVAALKRIGRKPLKLLKWAVHFSQWDFSNDPEALSMAEVELTCFAFVVLRGFLGLPPLTQIKALMTDPHLCKQHSYRGPEVYDVQRRFTEVLRAAAGDGEFPWPLRFVTATFTQKGGLNYVTELRSRHSAEEQRQAKLEHIVLRFLRLLDNTVRTGTRGGERLTPIRAYVGVCPEKEDGCGKLFAKSRSDQDYCSRRCVSHAQVKRFRRNQRSLKQLYPGKQMKRLTASERKRVFQLAESLALN
jgi:hypothetical protein